MTRNLSGYHMMDEIVKVGIWGRIQYLEQEK